MSLSEFVTRIVALRNSGNTWDEVASVIGSETGEVVNVASLKKAFARATSDKVIPASVEKPAKPRAAVRPTAAAPTGVKPDAAEGLRAALTAAETRSAEAITERDAARSQAVSAERKAAAAEGEIDRLKAEIEAGKRRIGPREGTGEEASQNEVIDGLRAQLAEALQAVERWEKWDQERGDDAPRSRPIMVAAMVVVALIVGAGSGLYGSRFIANPETIKVAAAATIQEVKPARVKIESESIKVPEKGVLDRPAGLPPLPPKAIVEGALTGAKTICPASAPVGQNRVIA